MTDGEALYDEIRSKVKEHFWFKEEWHYDLVCLWVLECPIARALPSVFYLPIGGNIGTAKTTLQRFLCKLVRGLFFGNASIAVLARAMTPFQPVVIDEYDVNRGEEYNAVRDALLRDGYTKGATYDRWDVKANRVDRMQVFSAKAFGYTGALDGALVSRGYPLPMVEGPQGRDGLNLVIANNFQALGDLSNRLRLWGARVLKEWPESKVEQLMRSDAFKDKVEKKVLSPGANRATQLGVDVVAVAELAGIDLGDILMRAQVLRDIETFAASDEDQDRLAVAVLRAVNEVRVELPYDRRHARVKQSDVRLLFDQARRPSYPRPVTAAQFARLREAIGIDRTMLGTHGRATYFNLSKETLQELYERVKDSPLLNEVEPYRADVKVPEGLEADRQQKLPATPNSPASPNSPAAGPEDG